MCANNSQKWWFHFAQLDFAFANTKKARTQYRISPKANSVSTSDVYIVFRMETKCFYYESKCKIKRRWMQDEKMHCSFASASSKCRRDCAIHEEFFDCSFCLTFDFAGFTSLVPSFFFSRKLRERKTQPSKMQKSKSILGIFETQIHTFGTNVTFWWLWFSIGALFIRSIAKHFQQHNRHCFIPIRACRNICMWTKPVFFFSSWFLRKMDRKHHFSAWKMLFTSVCSRHHQQRYRRLYFNVKDETDTHTDYSKDIQWK